MKMKLIDYYDKKRPKGYEMEIDKIIYNPTHAGCFAVRVISEWKTPTYMSIAWFVKLPDAEQAALETGARGARE